MEMRISVGVGEINAQVPVISMASGWRGPPLGALPEGVSTFTSGLPQISATLL
jgi:hypothetical protein